MKAHEIREWKSFLAITEVSPWLNLHNSLAESPSTKSCHRCFKRCNNLCASCRGVYYCGRQCQSDDWIIHKAYCKEIKQGLEKWISSERLNAQKMEDAKAKSGKFFHATLSN